MSWGTNAWRRRQASTAEKERETQPNNWGTLVNILEREIRKDKTERWSGNPMS